MIQIKAGRYAHQKLGSVCL